ncbi:small, acid-soluble spore protein K [Bacillaceae bacterium S4-13-58]
MRNKKKGFPEMHLDGEPRAKAIYASKRANGTIQTRPNERMQESSQRTNS